MLHAVTVVRMKTRIPDGGHGCDSIHGYAFRARCSCGWVGSRRTLYVESLSDGRSHRLSEGLIESSGTT